MTGDCWYWTGGCYWNGYGILYSPEAKRQMRAHRYTYELFVGPILKGLELDHLCRQRNCVNPEHLKPSTRRENLLAPGSRSNAAINAAKTHCPSGHTYNESNTSITPRGTRRCKACHSIDEARRRALKSVPRIIKVACPSGHAYDEKNTYLDSTNRRHCRACSRDKMRASRASALGVAPILSAAYPSGTKDAVTAGPSSFVTSRVDPPGDQRPYVTEGQAHGQFGLDSYLDSQRRR